jgi:hypothetical protein
VREQSFEEGVVGCDGDLLQVVVQRVVVAHDEVRRLVRHLTREVCDDEGVRLERVVADAVVLAEELLFD